MRHRSDGLLFESEDGRSRFLVEPGSPPRVVGRRPPFEPHSVKVPSRIASREHVRITAGPTDSGPVLVEDAGSAGGAYLDDDRVLGPTAIGPGARLRLAADAVYRTRAFAGASLHQLLRVDDAPAGTRTAAATMARDLLAALRPLHAAGGVHGNLDWHHVLRDDAGAWTVLVDGWTVLDPDGVLNCNPAYCAPEVFVRGALVAASDVYSVGLLVYEARFGHRPFDDELVHEHLRRKAAGGPPAWRAGRPAADEEAFFTGLLAAQPERRLSLDDALARAAALARA
ncbi:MAG TPA: FHA domain-containing protein [Kofleriaceae bacterium]|nr:FHA domain-containing protein [Kofleriaceae bacterium]